MNPRASSEYIQILALPESECFYFEGVERPIAEFETRIGKKLCTDLRVTRENYSSFMTYSATQLVCHHFTNGLELKAPASLRHFDIKNMGAAGFGLFARSKITAYSVIAYYLGVIEPPAAVAPSAYGMRLFNDESYHLTSTPYHIDLPPDGISTAGLLQHLPARAGLDHRYDFSGPDIKKKVATANVSWDTVHLFARPHGGSAVIVLYAIRDIEAGELLGIDYTADYWWAAGKSPLLFDRKGAVIAAESYRYKAALMARSIDTEEHVSLVATCQKTLVEIGNDYITSKQRMGMRGQGSPVDEAMKMIRTENGGKLSGAMAGAGTSHNTRARDAVPAKPVPVTTLETPLSLKEKGNRAFGNGNYKAALGFYETGIKLDASVPELWYNKAMCLENLNELHQAHSAYKQALELRPAYEKARNRLAELEKRSAASSTVLLESARASPPPEKVHAGDGASP